MYELIVLGLIPGTQMQINFEMWQQIAGGLCTLVIVWRVHRLHIIRNAVISLYMLRLSRHATIA